MEDILLLLVFSYPGAVSDLVYTTLAKDKTFYHEPSGSSRIARDFFISAIVTVITMRLALPTGDGGHTLSNWIESLQKSEILWKYIGISLFVSIVFGYLWFGSECAVLRLRNWWAKRKGANVNTQHGATWFDILRTPEDVDLAHLAVVVRDEENKIVCCGLPYALPADIRKEPAMALMHCDRVLEELENPKGKSLIGADTVVYYDMEHGKKIEFRHAWELIDAINAGDVNPKSSTLQTSEALADSASARPKA